MAKPTDPRRLERLIARLCPENYSLIKFTATGEDCISLEFAPTHQQGESAAMASDITSAETAIVRRKLELKDPETIDAIIKARLMGSH